ncbi:hypothetical protein PoB_001909500 [Plakobranchus ocellatus]|uniref:Uncharacterized protein n=1 Tax=Plakobranchus ocellatus TaxID=259542 RepID=A0AAV3ZDF5_9GAST|nr:hypothetical protein PoB_001909500 [Plakobranchus ocellatus]
MGLRERFGIFGLEDHLCPFPQTKNLHRALPSSGLPADPGEGLYTVRHILIECPHFQVTMRKYFSVTDMYRLFGEINPSCIVDYLKELGVYSFLLKFLSIYFPVWGPGKNRLHRGCRGS